METYGYGYGNPVNYTDRDGLTADPIETGGGAGPSPLSNVGPVGSGPTGTGGGYSGWGLWSQYSKIYRNGQWYAYINGRYYTPHAINQMAPRGLGGRSISPNFVDYTIRTGSASPQKVGNELRTYHRSGDVWAVTAENGTIVISAGYTHE